MSYSTGIHPDRIVATTIEKLADQSKAPKNFTIYTAIPNVPLPAGEYAVVFYNRQVRSPGYFAGVVDSYFDFGID